MIILKKYYKNIIFVNRIIFLQKKYKQKESRFLRNSSCFQEFRCKGTKKI
jgi:hypothetical protein